MNTDTDTYTNAIADADTNTHTQLKQIQWTRAAALDTGEKASLFQGGINPGDRRISISISISMVGICVVSFGIGMVGTCITRISFGNIVQYQYW